MKKLYNTIVEIETKGTYQQQAKKLYDDERKYKKLIAKYNRQMEEITDQDEFELWDDLFILKKKYGIRLENVKNEMCYLNKRMIDSLEVIESFVQFKDFAELFDLKEYEIDENESFYDNLLMSSNYIGHVCRQGLIQNEKLVKELIG